MDVDALFDKLRIDLADLGVDEARDGATRLLVDAHGVPFARLSGETMSFRAPEGSTPARQAAALETSRPVAGGDWQAVPAQDVSEWESLARSALTTLTDPTPAGGGGATAGSAATGGGTAW